MGPISSASWACRCRCRFLLPRACSCCRWVLLARPDQGLMTAITSDTSGGAVSRRLLPAALLLPLLLGWIGLSGQRAGLSAPSWGWPCCLANISTLVVLVILNARRLYEADQRRTRMRRSASASCGASRLPAPRQSRQRPVPRPGGIWAGRDPDGRRGGRITLVNSQAERLFGYPREELLGKPVEVLVPERFASGTLATGQATWPPAHPADGRGPRPAPSAVTAPSCRWKLVSARCLPSRGCR